MQPTEADQFEQRIDAALQLCDCVTANRLAESYVRQASQESTGEIAQSSPWLRSHFAAARTNLAVGRLRQALELANSIIPHVGKLPTTWTRQVWLTVAESYGRLGNHPKALDALHRAMSDSDAVTPIQQLLAVRIRCWAGQVAELGAELESCSRALQFSGDVHNLMLLRYEEGRGWAEREELKRAHECWSSALHIGSPLGSIPLRGDVHLQCGKLEHLCGNPQSALDEFDRALRCYTRQPDRELQTHLSRALVLMDLNQTSVATRIIEEMLAGTTIHDLPEEVQPLARMLSVLTGEEQQAERTDRELEGWAASSVDAAGARRFYYEAFRSTDSEERKARHALAIGMLSVRVGDEREARRWLTCAVAAARALGNGELLWRSLHTLGVMHAEEGREDEARSLLEEAVDVSETQALQLSRPASAAAFREQRSEILEILMRAACKRGDAGQLFRYQELKRGRLLIELWHAAGCSTLEATHLESVEATLAALETNDLASAHVRSEEKLRLRRDRYLEEFLSDRSRPANAAVPLLPSVEELGLILPEDTLYLSPVPIGGDLHLLTVDSSGPATIHSDLGSLAAAREQMSQLRGRIEAQLRFYRQGTPDVGAQAEPLNECLAELGAGPIGTTIQRVLRDQPTIKRIVWAPDGEFYGLPLSALRIGDHYLIEKCQIITTLSGALYVHHHNTRRRHRRAGIVVTESPQVLPGAIREGKGVHAAIPASQHLEPAAVTKAKLRDRLAAVGIAHFACHADFDNNQALRACIRLPSGEKFWATDWLDRRFDNLSLVTLSACRSAELTSLVGNEVFGLVAAALGGGVRSIVAGLWPVADRETVAFMWRFYRHLMVFDAPTSLAMAQRDSLRAPESASPLFWAVFAAFGDPSAISPTPRWLAWWRRWRQFRHRKRFSTAEKMD